VFVSSDGRLHQTGLMPRWMLASQDAAAPAGGHVLELPEGADLAQDYADQSTTPWTVKARPDNSAVLTGMKISNVPNPSTITIDGGEPATVTDGEVDLEFTQPGTYVIQVSSWPMLDATFTVTEP
jgi:hypothetical protein